jgi:hypothetical protein
LTQIKVAPQPTWSSSRHYVEEPQMPAEATLFVAMVVVAFTLLGLTLAWVQRRTNR